VAGPMSNDYDDGFVIGGGPKVEGEMDVGLHVAEILLYGGLGYLVTAPNICTYCIPRPRYFANCHRVQIFHQHMK
jgi:hypothetical protein